MSNKQEEIERLSDMYETIEKLVRQYNKMAASGNHDSRVGLMFAQAFVEDYIEEGEEIPTDIDSFLRDREINPYVSVRTGGAHGWFPSGFCS